MKHFLLLVSLYLLILTSCKKSGTGTSPGTSAGTKTKLLTLTIDAGFSTTLTDDWVLIHDINGKLLEYKSFETGNSFTIETSKDVPGNNISITFLSYEKNSSHTNHILKTYLLNGIGQTWTLKKEITPSSPPDNILGNFTVNVSGLQAGSACEFSNKKSISFVNGNWDGGSNVLSGNLSLISNTPGYYFYMADNTGSPRYKFLKNIQPNDVINLSFSNMKNFDKTTDVTFPATKLSDIYYAIRSIEPGQQEYESGYWINSNVSNTYFPVANNLKTKITLGYLDTFSTYKTSLTIGPPAFKYFYNKSGPAPTSISLPLSAQFAITNSAISSFSFTNNQSFTIRSSDWFFFNPTTPTISTDWIVIAPPNSTQKNLEIPAEFATMYPQFSIAQLNHLSSGFTIQGNSYEDLIEVTFKGKAKPETYEEYGIEVR